MGLIEFNKLPINTLVGADWKTFKELTAGRTVDGPWKGKYRLTKAVCRLLSVLAPLQDRRYKKLLANEPLKTALCLSLVIGVRVPLLYTTCFRATSVLVIAPLTKRYFRTS